MPMILDSTVISWATCSPHHHHHGLQYFFAACFFVSFHRYCWCCHEFPSTHYINDTYVYIYSKGIYTFHIRCAFWWCSQTFFCIHDSFIHSFVRVVISKISCTHDKAHSTEWHISLSWHRHFLNTENFKRFDHQQNMYRCSPTSAYIQYLDDAYAYIQTADLFDFNGIKFCNECALYIYTLNIRGECLINQSDNSSQICELAQ